MSQVFPAADPRSMEMMTPPELRYTGAATREVMPGWDLGTIMLGELGDPKAAVVSMLRIAPNETLHRHGHDCKRVEIIVQGSITLPDGRVLTPGDVMVSQPGEFYGPHVAGPEGCLSAEIFSVASGMAPMHHPEDGPESQAAQIVEKVTKVINRMKSEQASAQ
jgi:hypothetical protein